VANGMPGDPDDVRARRRDAHWRALRARANKKRPPVPESPSIASDQDNYEQPVVVPQLTHLWQLPLGIMIDPHSGQVARRCGR
jgi:hypothetical protein